MKYNYQGKTALITGASSGIGAEFAQQLASRGMNFILVARSKDKLDALAAQLQAQHQCSVNVITADLTEPQADKKLFDAVQAQGLQVDMLINNAGFGTYGAFTTQQAEREADEIQLNVQALVALTHRFLPAMLERDDGAIINVASAAAFQPTPYMSIYGATKAFVLSFTLGLWAEMKGRSVFVHALCPGPVATDFFAATGNADLEENAQSLPLMSVERCVAICLKSFQAGKAFVVPGISNKLATASSKMTPRELSALISGKLIGLMRGK